MNPIMVKIMISSVFRQCVCTNTAIYHTIDTFIVKQKDLCTMIKNAATLHTYCIHHYRVSLINIFSLMAEATVLLYIRTKEEEIGRLKRQTNMSRKSCCFLI